MLKIVIYSTEYCPYCVRAKQLLESKGAEYEEIRVDEEPERRSEMVEKSGGQRTVPQIFIGNRHIGGCDDLFVLNGEGKLDPLLEQEKKEGK